MATIDEAKLASVQAVTGTNWGWDGDWHALFDANSIPAGDFNGRLLAYLNAKLIAGAVITVGLTNLVDAQNTFAVFQSAPTWASMGTFTA